MDLPLQGEEPALGDIAEDQRKPIILKREKRRKVELSASPPPVESSILPLDSFKVYVAYGKTKAADVRLSGGNGTEFIQTIHQEILQFLARNEIPLMTFATTILGMKKDATLSFFNHHDWALLTRDDKLNYARLHNWLKLPELVKTNEIGESKRKLDLSNELRDDSSNNYNALERPILPKSTTVDKSDRLNDDGATTSGSKEGRKKKQEGRTTTTRAERAAIKNWARDYPHHTVTEKGQFAKKLGLHICAVTRTISYSRRAGIRAQQTELDGETVMRVENNLTGVSELKDRVTDGTKSMSPNCGLSNIQKNANTEYQQEQYHKEPEYMQQPEYQPNDKQWLEYQPEFEQIQDYQHDNKQNLEYYHGYEQKQAYENEYEHKREYQHENERQKEYQAVYVKNHEVQPEYKQDQEKQPDYEQKQQYQPSYQQEPQYQQQLEYPPQYEQQPEFQPAYQHESEFQQKLQYQPEYQQWLEYSSDYGHKLEYQPECQQQKVYLSEYQEQSKYDTNKFDNVHLEQQPFNDIYTQSENSKYLGRINDSYNAVETEGKYSYINGNADSVTANYSLCTEKNISKEIQNVNIAGNTKVGQKEIRHTEDSNLDQIVGLNNGHLSGLSERLVVGNSQGLDRSVLNSADNESIETVTGDLQDTRGKENAFLENQDHSNLGQLQTVNIKPTLKTSELDKNEYRLKIENRKTVNWKRKKFNKTPNTNIDISNETNTTHNSQTYQFPKENLYQDNPIEHKYGEMQIVSENVGNENTPYRETEIFPTGLNPSHYKLIASKKSSGGRDHQISNINANKENIMQIEPKPLYQGPSQFQLKQDKEIRKITPIENIEPSTSFLKEKQAKVVEIPALSNDIKNVINKAINSDKDKFDKPSNKSLPIQENITIDKYSQNKPAPKVLRCVKVPTKKGKELLKNRNFLNLTHPPSKQLRPIKSKSVQNKVPIKLVLPPKLARDKSLKFYIVKKGSANIDNSQLIKLSGENLSYKTPVSQVDTSKPVVGLITPQTKMSLKEKKFKLKKVTVPSNNQNTLTKSNLSNNSQILLNSVATSEETLISNMQSSNLQSFNTPAASSTDFRSDIKSDLNDEQNNELLSSLDKFCKENPNPSFDILKDKSAMLGITVPVMCALMEAKHSTQTKVTPPIAPFKITSSLVTPAVPIEAKEEEEGSPEHKLSMEMLELVEKIRRKDLPYSLSRKLRQHFGNKVFCTLDDIKVYALENDLSFQDICRQLENNEHIRLVSENIYQKLLAQAEDEEFAPYPKSEEFLSSTVQPRLGDNWMTNSDIMIESLETDITHDYKNVELKKEPNVTKIKPEEGENNAKLEDNKSNIRLEDNESKVKFKDGGNVQLEDSVDNNQKDYFHYNDINEIAFNDLLHENIGNINLLDDTLGLFDENFGDTNIFNDMLNLLDEEECSNEIKPLSKEHIEEAKDPPMKYNTDKMSKLRKLFFEGEGEITPDFALEVVSVTTSQLKSDVYEVELTDNEEVTNNFYFRTRSKSICTGQKLKLTRARCTGARICVDVFEIVGSFNKDEDIKPPVTIEDDFFIHLRKIRLQKRDLFEMASPKTLTDYVELEEVVKNYIESYGGVKQKMEILFTLRRSGKQLSSKLIKLFSIHLKLERSEVEKLVQQTSGTSGPDIVTVMNDHNYCSLSHLLNS